MIGMCATTCARGSTPTRSTPVVPAGARWVLERLRAPRSRRVFLLLIAVWIINGFDLVLTLLAEHDGILHEQNPIARALLDHSALAVALFKVGLVGVATCLLWRCRAYRCTELAAVLAVLVYAVVALQWKACYDNYDIAMTGEAASVQVVFAGQWELSLPAF